MNIHQPGVSAPDPNGPAGAPAATGAQQLVRHWWNCLWGRFNRRDVYIRTDGVTFTLELRLGGQDGRPWTRHYPTLDAAINEAEQHMAPDQQWRDLTAAHSRVSSRPKPQP
ncbi:hypothetical protein GCM10010532_097940 [Dactylosporangium siamense]|uniref:Uncharacterized protein n=1 Tax=Dactylosporangium siamense TaxID=685454 RepID=A0A919PZD5_9ACTN|nr:hypothetical protein Dsi01nite_112050 [Dactylosporangium siamense]